MARSRSTKNKSSAESSDGQRDWGQVLGLVYLGLGVLIFVALLTYDRSDLSSNTVPPNPVIQNWIGPFGAIVGKGLFFFFGAAAYLVPTICLGFGLAHVFQRYQTYSQRVTLQ